MLSINLSRHLNWVRPMFALMRLGSSSKTIFDKFASLSGIPFKLRPRTLCYCYNPLKLESSVPSYYYNFDGDNKVFAWSNLTSFRFCDFSVNDSSNDSCSDEFSCLLDSELSSFGGKVEVPDFYLSFVLVVIRVPLSLASSFSILAISRSA